MFIDRAEILIHAGAGGRGCSAMTRMPFHRYPRPIGGNGGDGGDVILLGDPQLSTLLDLQYRHEFRAERGAHGSGNNKTGKRGADVVVHLPLGTMVYEAATNALLRDLTRPFERVVLARGGRGGVGNTNAPQATPGQPGEERRLRLELKLIAEVGLIGVPNAGKSSLLARLSTARPKIAAYPFTTKTPVLGVVDAGQGRAFVACDIPGLIEGAHAGRGLGIQFLRHIERTRLLLHVVDLASVDGHDPLACVAQVNDELAAYNPVLAERPQLLVANKMDLPQAQEALAAFRAKVGVPVFPISCATGAGLPTLIQAAWRRLQALQAAADVSSLERDT